MSVQVGKDSITFLKAPQQVAYSIDIDSSHSRLLAYASGDSEIDDVEISLLADGEAVNINNYEFEISGDLCEYTDTQGNPVNAIQLAQEDSKNFIVVNTEHLKDGANGIFIITAKINGKEVIFTTFYWSKGTVSYAIIASTQKIVSIGESSSVTFEFYKINNGTYEKLDMGDKNNGYAYSISTHSNNSNVIEQDGDVVYYVTGGPSGTIACSLHSITGAGEDAIDEKLIEISVVVDILDQQWIYYKSTEPRIPNAPEIWIQDGTDTEETWIVTVPNKQGNYFYYSCFQAWDRDGNLITSEPKETSELERTYDYLAAPYVSATSVDIGEDIVMKSHGKFIVNSNNEVEIKNNSGDNAIVMNNNGMTLSSSKLELTGGEISLDSDSKIKMAASSIILQIDDNESQDMGQYFNFTASGLEISAPESEEDGSYKYKVLINNQGMHIQKKQDDTDEYDDISLFQNDSLITAKIKVGSVADHQDQTKTITVMRNAPDGGVFFTVE